MSLANEDIADGRPQSWGAKASIHYSEMTTLETNADSCLLQRELDSSVCASRFEAKKQRFITHFDFSFNLVNRFL